jgi:YVTN family beta-propeller protein
MYLYRSLFGLCALLLMLTFLLAGNLRARPDLVPKGFLTIVNQHDHTVILFDLAASKSVATIDVGVNGHEVVISPDGKFAYVPIYGNSGVGKPGTDGQFIDVIDLHNRAIAAHINLGKPVRPHCAKFGPDGLLYVSAELANAIYVVDTAARKVLAEIPTGAEQSHMFVVSPDGKRAYTANVSTGTVSVLDLQKRALITVIPVAKSVQRISISPDGRHVYTHDQDQPRIAVIDTSTNQVSGFIAVPSTIYSSAVTADGQVLVAASPSGNVFEIDLKTSKMIATVEVPPSSGALFVPSDASDRRAFLSCPQAGNIQVLDVGLPKVSAVLPLTPGVDGLAWSSAL